MINGALGLVHKYISSKASQSRRDPADTSIKRIGLVAIPGGGSGRAQMEEPDFNLEEITFAYDTDSYIRQAVDKYTDLIFKAGWEITSINDDARDYIKLRLALIAEATQTPLEELFNQIAEDLVKYGNVFIAKARMKKDYQFPKGVQVNQVGDRDPVVGYFVLPPSSMKIERDKNGAVKRYEQSFSGGDKVVFKPEDMIHLYWKKRRGMAFGIPFLIPVLPDVRLLREIEDNVNRLLHKYLHPLYKFQVGLDKDGFQSTPEEIEMVRSLVERMPTDGTLVLPERYNVEVVGAQGEAINASWALKYFEQRVFTGLGVPETVFGRGSTTNRSTADNLTSEMHDRVKAFQRVISTGVIYHIINELLLEGGFDVVMNPEDKVEFKFLEIAIDEQIKLENQATYLYEHNAITFSEMRQRIGYETTVDESEMYLNRVKIPGIDAEKRGDDEEAGDPETNNKQKPENQHGKKTSPKKTTSHTPAISENYKRDHDNITSLNNKLLESYEVLRSDVVSSIVASKENPSVTKQIPMVFDQIKSRMMKTISSYNEVALRSGISASKQDLGVSREPDVNLSLALRGVNRECEEYIDKTFSQMKAQIEEKIEKNEGNLAPSIFDLSKSKVSNISRFTLMRSYNLGYAFSAKELGANYLISIARDNPCNVCTEKSKDKIYLKDSLVNLLPPWHINCWCELKIDKNGGAEV